MTLLKKLGEVKVIKKTWLRLMLLKTIFFVYSRFFVKKIVGRYRKNKATDYPTTIQLPITYACNFNCIMCGMEKLVKKHNFSTKQLGNILEDELFKKIQSVGVNGGEPFILENIEEYIQVILEKLPKLKNIYVISNGYFTNKILTKSLVIKCMCYKKHVKFHLSVSIDGFGAIHDKIRSKEGAFSHSAETCNKIMQNKSKYCDSFGVICTVTKINVYHLAEFEVWSQKIGLPVSYNIATIHKRICNEYKFANFSVYTDERAKMMAAEFFYSKFLQTKSERYFGLYYVVKYKKRIALCDHQRQVVTITPDGSISYCAVHSDEIGNILASSAKEIFFSYDNLKYRKEMQSIYCSSCSHYLDSLTQHGYLSLYAKELIKLARCYY